MGACEGIEREWVKIKRGSSEKRGFPQILMSWGKGVLPPALFEPLPFCYIALF